MKLYCVRILLFILSTLFIVKAAHGLCVNVPEANLRSGPGTKHEKTWEVFKYMPFKKISQKGNWYKVKDVDGDIHWIYRKLVTDKYKCATVKIEKANVRTGPGTNYGINVISPAMKYTSFKIIGSKQGWMQLMDEYGETGWIYGKLLWTP